MEKINIEEIMEQIRADIKERGLKDDEIEFDSIVLLDGGNSSFYSDEVYDQLVNEIDKLSEVQSYRELYGNPIERFIKKIIRRLVALCIAPIVDDQNRFNKNVYSGFVMNYRKFQDDEIKLQNLEKKMYEYEKRIMELEKQLSGDKK